MRLPPHTFDCVRESFNFQRAEPTTSIVLTRIANIELEIILFILNESLMGCVSMEMKKLKLWSWGLGNTDRNVMIVILTDFTVNLIF
jgi:hypothetical protein